MTNSQVEFSGKEASVNFGPLKLPQPLSHRNVASLYAMGGVFENLGRVDDALLCFQAALEASTLPKDIREGVNLWELSVYSTLDTVGQLYLFDQLSQDPPSWWLK